jgi:hypothetical protein
VRRIHAALAIVTVLSALAATAIARSEGGTSGKLPPIGKRTYVIDGEPSAPVTIRSGDTKAKVFLKDPVGPSAPIKLAPIKKSKPKPVAKAAPRATKMGRMNFKKVSISGHLRQPRVEFARERLPMDRADELTPPDFFQKVYEPASDWQ